MRDDVLADIDAIVIGAGAVGLAVARELAISGLSVVVIEAADAIGTGTSSRNSEVIHAGMYYPHGSLKAKFCVEGNKRIYEYCDKHGIPHRRIGKLIVAASQDEMHVLEGMQTKGAANGCRGLELLTARQASELEPALLCHGALYSAATGIIDSHAYMLALRHDAEEAGADFAFSSPFEKCRSGAQEFLVSVGGIDPIDITCNILVNSAGLSASDVARNIENLDGSHIPATHYAKGNYFVLSGRSPFSHLIYPAPGNHGLGVHLTLDLGQQARFGPDVEWVDNLDYEVDPARAEAFETAIRRYWPTMPPHALIPAYSGIRPKICQAGDPPADFRIDGPEVHGIAGLVNLFGIESPGLTSSLAIASAVANICRL